MLGSYFLRVNAYDHEVTYEYLMDSDGSEIYQGKPGELVKGYIEGDKFYVFVECGNYEGVKDLQGHYLYPRILTRLTDD